MPIRKPLVWTGNGLAQLPDSDRLQYDIDLGGSKHYRGSTLPVNPQVFDTWDELTVGGVWVRAWFWNGAFWLSVQEFRKDSSVTNISANTIVYYDLPIDANVFVTSFKISMLVGATNTTVAYWNFALSRATGATTNVSLAAALTTNGQAISAWYTSAIAINTHINIASSGSKVFRVDATKVSTPSNITGAIEISYRLARI